MVTTLRRFWPLGILLAALLIYARSFGFDWTMDDHLVIVTNPDVTSLANFFADSYPGRPLRELTYLLDYAWFGLEPAGWHLQNILWHALSACLVFALVRRLIPSAGAAWCAALLFVAHPVAVEVVANISHRKESLALFFCLAAQLFLMQSYAASRPRRPLWLAGAVMLFAVAMLAKQTAAALILVWLAWDFCAGERSWLFRHRSATYAIGGGLVVAVLGWFVWVWQWSPIREAVVPVLVKVTSGGGDWSVAAAYRMSLKAFGFMYAKLAWPAGLSMEYSLAAPESLLEPGMLFGLLLGIVPSPTCPTSPKRLWACWRRQQKLAFGLAWLLAFWLPVSNLFWPLSYYAADRYLYLPLAGLAILVGLLLDHLVRTRGQWVFGGAVLLVLICAGLSWQQSGFWRNDLTLAHRILAVNPDSTAGLKGVGIALLRQGEADEAIDYFRRAMLNFDDSEVFFLLGQAYEQTGDRRQAMQNYLRFVQMNDPLYPGKVQEARRVLRTRYGLGL